MLISDLSHLEAVKTSVVGGSFYPYYPVYYKVKIDVDQDAKAYSKAYAKYGNADSKAIAYNVSNISL